MNRFCNDHAITSCAETRVNNTRDSSNNRIIHRYFNDHTITSCAEMRVSNTRDTNDAQRIAE